MSNGIRILILIGRIINGFTRYEFNEDAWYDATNVGRSAKIRDRFCNLWSIIIDCLLCLYAFGLFYLYNDLIRLLAGRCANAYACNDACDHSGNDSFSIANSASSRYSRNDSASYAGRSAFNYVYRAAPTGCRTYARWSDREVRFLRFISFLII